MSESSTKLCSVCKRQYPSTTEYFDHERRNSLEFGHLSARCRLCRREQDRKDYQRKQERIQQSKQVGANVVWASRRKLSDIQCEHCAVTFAPRRTGMRFCSRECVNGHFKIKGDLDKKQCPDCRRTLPATTEFYLKAVDRPPRYVSTYCRDCSRMHWLVRSKTAAEGYGMNLVQMYKDQGGVCAYCESELHGSYQIDHMIPKSRGGANELMNFALACIRCNASKGSRTAEEFWEILCRT